MRFSDSSSDWSRDVNDRIADGRRIQVFKIHLYVYDRIWVLLYDQMCIRDSLPDCLDEEFFI